MEKIEYPPLLEPGFHKKNLSDIEELCVHSFKNTSRRLLIYNHFCRFLDLLNQLHIHIELWIDGSFVTEKEKPDDIDVVGFASGNELQKLSSTQKDLLTELIKGKAKKEFFTDFYFVGSIDENEYRNYRSYWRGFFCFTRDEKPKGAIKFEVNP